MLTRPNSFCLAFNKIKNDKWMNEVKKDSQRFDLLLNKTAKGRVNDSGNNKSNQIQKFLLFLRLF